MIRIPFAGLAIVLTHGILGLLCVVTIIGLPSADEEIAMMRSSLLIGAVILGLLISCESEDSTRPSPKLEGTWDLIGYVDHGVPGATTGSATFRNDGTYSISGTVTYPGEPEDSLDVSGTYQVIATVATLTTPDGPSSWSLTFSSDRVVLSLRGSEPPTTMTLRRKR